jgi:hypothetical protein
LDADDTKRNQPEYFSYLLRIWRTGQKEKEQWRATLEHITSGEKYFFTSLQELFSFIRQKTSQTTELDLDQ